MNTLPTITTALDETEHLPSDLADRIAAELPDIAAELTAPFAAELAESLAESLAAEG